MTTALAFMFMLSTLTWLAYELRARQRRKREGDGR
jgi:hypothetical protein